MCWYSKKFKIKTAKKDIPVWKVVKTDCWDPTCCLSYYKNYSYFKDILEIRPIEFRLESGSVKGTTGFHSYSKKLKWNRTENYIYIVATDFFGFTIANILVYQNRPDVKIARFYIPKGAQYAENELGEIISSAIVFNNFID